MKKNHIILIAVAAGALVLFAGYRLVFPKNQMEIMAVTGATPLAVKQDVKSGTTLEVSGLTKKVYTFGADALNAFSPTYIRTREVEPDGKFMGTYRYSGIPVLHILEGVAVKKPEKAAFDRPLDMIVTFENADGGRVHFSYGELTMTDDSDPVVLAFDRKELVPSKPKKDEPYKWNAHRENIKGLRLVCAAEPDTGRYLDDVKRISISEVEVDNSLLPVMKKGEKCVSASLTVLAGGKAKPVRLDGVERAAVKGWVRTGHGQGYKGISNAEGYSLASLLVKNFPGCGPKNFFLFVACDGYRSLLSGTEIFRTADGRGMMLIDKMDGKKPAAGPMLGPVNDYYVDRDVWGLSHIMLIEEIR
ncbi:MAG TPA: hypothetical protein VLM75_08505 [Spirochaetota bacterium]|nr:hypothetical protein [Spirochaetota bacterium]